MDDRKVEKERENIFIRAAEELDWMSGRLGPGGEGIIDEGEEVEIKSIAMKLRKYAEEYVEHSQVMKYISESLEWERRQIRKVIGM